MDSSAEEHRLSAMRAALARPEVKARQRRRCQIIAARKLSWCPPEKRDEYRALVKRFGDATRARNAILATMTPFERQLQAVLSGRAKVVTKVKLATPAHEFTLGGVASGMLA